MRELRMVNEKGRPAKEPTREPFPCRVCGAPTRKLFWYTLQWVTKAGILPEWHAEFVCVSCAIHTLKHWGNVW